MLLPSEWSLVVSGGGSGGHLFPALAVIEALRARRQAPQWIVFLTADRSIDRKILLHEGLEQIALPNIDSGMLLRRPWHSTKTLYTSVRQASRVLKTLPNPVILGTGGFGSIPGCLAARWRERPIVLLEQNVVPGRATTLLSRFARLVCVSFLETKRFLPEQIPTEVTGNPVRAAIARMATLPSASREKCLLILGGSQGTAALNHAMISIADHEPELFSGWTLIHQSGERDCDAVRGAYFRARLNADVAPFFDDLIERYRRSSLVISRAGGTSLAELACAKVPSILVPYPRSLRNHQLINAQHFAGHRAAMLIEQRRPDILQKELSELLTTLLNSGEQRDEMAAAMQNCARPEAADTVAGQLLQIAEKALRE